MYKIIDVIQSEAQDLYEFSMEILRFAQDDKSNY